MNSNRKKSLAVTKTIFLDSYSAWQRDTNENSNEVLKEFFQELKLI